MTVIVPRPTTVADGIVVDADFWNTEVRDAIEFLVNKPAFKAGPDTGGTSSTYTALALSNVYIDSTDIYNPLDPSTVKVAVPGVYEIYAQCQFTAGSTGARYIQVQKNGSVIAQGEIGANPEGNDIVSCSTLLYITPDDSVQVLVKETGTGSGFTGGVESATHLTMKWISRDA